MIKIIIVPIIIAIGLLVSSCGQSGGLYLPSNPPSSLHSSDNQQEG